MCAQSLHDGIQIRHLPEQRLHHRVARPVGAQRPRVADPRILVELRLPRRRVVREVPEDAGVNLLIRGAEVALVRFVDAAPRTLVARIEQTDRVVDDDALGDIGILRREARRQHAAHRVADDERLVDLQVLQQQARVARHVVEVVRNDRLRRPAEADLIGHDHAEPFLAKRVDRTAPVEPGEVHPMKQHDACGRSAAPARARPCTPSGCPARTASSADTTPACGYGTSSQVMLPGLTSAGVGGGAAACAKASSAGARHAVSRSAGRFHESLRVEILHGYRLPATGYQLSDTDASGCG